VNSVAVVTKNSPQIPFDFGVAIQKELFASLFSAVALNDVYWSRFASTTGKGTDRINGFQFAKRAPVELATASRKCLAGTYRFAPYLESLKTKGRRDYPRVIGIPIVRDRVVLKQLNAFLGAIYPDRVPKNIANSYVREIAADLANASDEKTWICSTDIKKFYDSIKRKRLLEILNRDIQCKEALQLISHAISTPTVPKNTHRLRHGEFQSGVGVPQGLAISNILASIYMKDVDGPMRKLDVKYWRYVDDVLIYGSEAQVANAHKSLKARLRFRGLTLHSLHSGKSHLKPLSESFGYLGYRFHWPTITVRDSTIERFLQSIAGKFSSYLHNSARWLTDHPYLTPERIRDIFVLELNERITGAISEKRRYGWIAYFSEISDQSLLHRLDHTIAGMFKRLPDFKLQAPGSLKRLARAYFEIKYNPTGGYIRNYDKIQGAIEKLKFLIERGRIDPSATSISDKEINDKYARYVFHSLASMLSDEGVAYG
jgi:RNA-directed DNA polymerase